MHLTVNFAEILSNPVVLTISYAFLAVVLAWATAVISLFLALKNG